MQRLDSLDGLRGVLAAYVLLGHMAPFAPLPVWLQRVLSHGGAAVDVFFALSGLVIAQSLSRAGGRAAPFLIARAARIFPVFLLAFAVAVAVAPLSCGYEFMPWIAPDSPARDICASVWPSAWLAEIGTHLTMTHGLFPAAVLPDAWIGFLGAAWSLSAEWQFYLVALLAARRRAGLCWILLALAAAGTAWRLAGPDAWQFSRAFLPNKAQFFALGVASVAVVEREDGAWRRFVPVFAVTMGLCATLGTVGKLLPPLAWTLFLAARAAPATARGATAVFANRGARYLGAISYCLYLVNEPIHKIAGPAVGWLAGGDGVLFTAVWLPVAAGVPFAAAAWLHVCLEAPAIRWGRKIAGRFAADGTEAIVRQRARGV